ncbi:MAG TPA: glycine cleavage system aminomethyltransferase GcvT [Streptosporangiaceae bacterium]|nr:glycine cleavage system aminomethyltransferase GcvT [Streptosporangiaceae bacterium]
MTDLRRTPLTGVHERLGATLTGFAGWLMPLRYGSETAEHTAVRTAAGLFDLSHMGEIMVTGPGAAAALDYALVGQPSALAPGRARYTMICAPDGGVIDDLIVYRLAADEFLVVANAANTGVVFEALEDRARGDAQVADHTDDYALIALQGPHAVRILAPLASADLAGVKYYTGYPATVAGAEVLLARTGYTGEDGFELFTRPPDAERVWAALTAAGAGQGLVPAGLAARDTLRLEAGMPLYGNELGPELTPFDAGLGRVVRLEKPGDFVGRAALAERAGAEPERELVGLVGRSRRVPRHGYAVLWDGAACGTVTSGAPSPTLGAPIAMAYVAPAVAREAGQAGAGTGGPGRLAVDIRGRAEPADLVSLPFYRRPA